MASSSSRNSSFVNPETLETKTFTWRLRPQLGHTGAQNGDLSTFKNMKSTSVTGSSASRLLSPTTGTSASNSQFQNPDQHNQFLRFQEFEVEAGQSMGMHSMWSLFMVSCGSTIPGQRSNTNISVAASLAAAAASCQTSNSDFIGLFLRKIFKSSRSPQSGYTTSTRNDEVLVRYKIEIMDREGEVLYTKDCETSAKDKLEVGYWDWKKIVPVSKFHNNPKGKSQTRESSGMEPTEDSLLLLRVSFVLVNRRKSPGRNKVSPRLGISSAEEETSNREAANGFLNLITSSKSMQPDIVIEITNRRKFFVHKKVLVGRSPAFSKLVGTDVNGKSRDVVKLDDISANTMELILKHIYTGQLEEEWTINPATATELIYASEKYGLPALKEFCNKHLVKGATKNNCYKLMEVAQLHNLEKAADDLMSYVSEGISSKSNSRKPSQESVAG